MSIVKLRNVKKTYKLGQTEVAALKGIDLDVEPGEFTAIMGPSGSGKTTLLNIIGCLDKMDVGSYQLRGEELGGRDFNDLADIRNRSIGFIFQAFNLIPVLDVAENIEFPCLIRGESRGPLRSRALAVARDVGLEPYLHHKPDELSGGQRQRVAIARALIAEPQLVLADEPTANLDSITSQQIIDLMLRLNRDQNVTFLFSTHDPRVVGHARRVVTIHDGVLADGAMAGPSAVTETRTAAS
jgi:putative ABC transport system ATP-binding protein